MDRVDLDLTGPHISVNGLTYICTAMCSFTKFVVAWPILDEKATTVARGLMERVILPLGSFRELLTDNGKEFENKLCHELCRLMGIEKLRTTFYTQQCNGGIERWHSTMNSLQVKTVEVHQKEWPQRLAYVVAAYNATVHESTGYSPNFLTFGRELAVPDDVALGNPPADRLSVNDYADHLVTSLQEAYCDARKHLSRAAERTKRYYDCKCHPLAFKPGDLVYVFSPCRFWGMSPKWQRKYSGLFEVVRQVNAVNYAVRKGPRGAVQIVHIDKLKPYLWPSLGDDVAC